MATKRVGILTGGGDVPGLNSVIKSVVYRGAEIGCEVIGIRRGWEGLTHVDLNDPARKARYILPLNRENTRTIDRTGGTFLHSSRTNPTKIKNLPPVLQGQKFEAKESTKKGPLRERREDIPLLVNYFVSKVSGRMGRQIKSIPKRAMEILTNCPWKGNIRELANFVERAVILSRGHELDVPVSELPTSSEISVAMGAPSTFRQAESCVIIDALRAASGRIAGKGGAAERLGLKRTTLQNKIRRLGITKAQYQN